jgi:hypothetical protein
MCEMKRWPASVRAAWAVPSAALLDQASIGHVDQQGGGLLAGLLHAGHVSDSA